MPLLTSPALHRFKSLSARLGLASCFILLAVIALRPLRDGGALAAAPAPQALQLEKRLRAVEDRLEILNILAASPLSSDIPSVSYQEAMYSEDSVMDRAAGTKELRGREAVVDTIRDADHLAAVAAGMTHFAGLPHIRITGDRAVATGFLQIVIADPDGPKAGLANYPPSHVQLVWRVTANRWELTRTAQGWRVTKRVIRSAPGKDALELLHRGIDTTD